MSSSASFANDLIYLKTVSKYIPDGRPIYVPVYLYSGSHWDSFIQMIWCVEQSVVQKEEQWRPLQKGPMYHM